MTNYYFRRLQPTPLLVHMRNMCSLPVLTRLTSAGVAPLTNAIIIFVVQVFFLGFLLSFGKINQMVCDLLKFLGVSKNTIVMRGLALKMQCMHEMSLSIGCI